MLMKSAFLFITAQVASAQLHSAPRRQLRRDTNAGDESNGADYFRHLVELSSMSMAQATLDEAPAQVAASKPRSSKSSKNPGPLELRFGPQLSPEKVAKKFDKLTDAYIRMGGIVGFASSDYSAPLVGYFSNLGVLAISYDDMQSVCVTKCYNDPACKAVGINELTEEGELKPTYQCSMINPELGPGAYIYEKLSSDLQRVNNGVVYTKKDENIVVPSHDEIACNISVTTVADDVSCFYGCILESLPNPNPAECVSNCTLTDDFVNYILPAPDCVAGLAGPTAITPCLTCLIKEGVDANPIDNICTANNETSLVRGLCRDECYQVPLNETNSTIDLSFCEPAIEAAMLCYNGSPEIPNVNRINGTAPFACPNRD